MIVRWVIGCLLVGMASAYAQNMSMMGMAPYAGDTIHRELRPTYRGQGSAASCIFFGPLPPNVVGCDEHGPIFLLPDGSIHSSNPMVQACPDGWGHGPTVSGTKPVCVAPDADK